MSETELLALVDVSHSTSGRARAALVDTIKPFLKHSNETVIKILPFGSSTAKRAFEIDSGTSTEQLAELTKDDESLVDSGHTNIGNAIKTAINQYRNSSVLLLSDGHETSGNAHLEASKASAQGLRVFPLIPDEADFKQKRLSISSVHAPNVVKAGELTQLRTSIRNELSVNSTAKLEIWLDQEKLFSSTVTVAPEREKLIVVKTPSRSGGLHRLRVALRDVNDTQGDSTPLDEKHRWLSVREKAKILLISGAKKDARVISKLLRQKGFTLQAIIANGKSKIPTTFKGYSSVILNNVAKRQLPSSFLKRLRKSVESGVGLLLIGGNRSFGLGGYVGTVLEKIAPVKFVPPRTTKRRLNSAVILVIDKSRSMIEQQKILAAKRAALVAIDALKKDDYVGVIGFDSTPFVIIRLSPVPEVKRIANQRLQNLTAAGRTNMLPALASARNSLSKAKASRKHIIILSDGKVPDAGASYITEIGKLRNAGVSVSTVALGLEADVPFLKTLSSQGKGAFYHTLDPSQLPQIFLHDIKVATGEKTLKENARFPVKALQDELQSTSLTRYPPVLGFVETLPKKGSTLELVTQKQNLRFPILSSWKYGAGKVIAYTSDANGRWSDPWVKWPQFSRFWGHIISAIRNKSSFNDGDIDFDLRHNINQNTIALDLAVYDETLGKRSAPQITAKIIEPGGELQRITFEAVAKGRFRASIDNARPGDYKINIKYGKVEFPPSAVTIAGDAFGERTGLGLNVQTLSDIAFLSGGAINPSPDQLSVKSRTSEKAKHLFVPLLVMAFLLIMIEAFMRELFSNLSSSLFERKNKQEQSKTTAVGDYGQKQRRVGSTNQ